MRRIFNSHSRAESRPGRTRRVGRLRPPPPAWLGLCLALVAGLLAGIPAARAQDAAAPLDYQVKAAFLVNFPKYVNWPSASFAGSNSPVTVAIFGDDNIAGEFGSMIEGGRTIDGHPLQLKRVSKVEDIAGCQILFVASSERQRLPAILETVKGAGILTVGDSDDFLEQGGIIQLVNRDRKIRFQVSLEAASQARLRISSRLLVVADAVKGKAE
jgi:hypothetical protein